MTTAFQRLWQLLGELAIESRIDATVQAIPESSQVRIDRPSATLFDEHHEAAVLLVECYEIACDFAHDVKLHGPDLSAKQVVARCTTGRSSPNP